MSTQADQLSALRGGEYDFLDFGCSKGGSLQLGKGLFGGRRGLGIDLDPAKVAASRHAGHDAMQADATSLQLATGSVSFVLMMHFLEHLPGFGPAQMAIKSACRVARDFVFIRHPWFDSDGALFDLGLKFYWSDWRGHPNRFGKIDFFKVLSQVPSVRRWCLFGYVRINTTATRDLIELNGPSDSQGATAADLERRASRPIDFRTYQQIACFIQINPDFELKPVFAALRLRGHELIFDSHRQSTPRPEVLPAAATAP
jgi:hypothetical protein